MSNSLSFDERSALISVIADSRDEISDINVRIEQLSDEAEYNVKIFREVKSLKSEREFLNEKIERASKTLRQAGEKAPA